MLRVNRLSITEVEAAWLAGIIDGEGFVGVVYAKRGRGSDARYYKPDVTVSMTHQETIRKICGFTDAKMYKKPRPKDRPNARQAYDWHCPRTVMLDLLIRVQRYSVTKRESIDLLISFLMLCEMETRDSEYEASVAEELRAITKTIRQIEVPPKSVEKGAPIGA